MKAVQRNYDLSNRTTGERLWLARKAAGLTQIKAARLAGLGANAYGDAEKDRNPTRIAPVPGIPALRTVPLPLLLALARRRSGLGLDGVAAAYGSSRVTVLIRERAGSVSLIDFWRKKGYRFRI